VAYLFGAMDSGRLPDDRSFTYSLLIRGLVWPFDSLWALVWWQTLAGIATALVGWHLLVHRLGTSRKAATLAMCAFSVEPAQLYYERMVLAESMGLLGFALFCAAAAAYVASGRAWWIPLAAVMGLCAATLRLNYVPVVLVISVITPLLRSMGVPRQSPARVAAHTALALAVTLALHAGFQQWVALIFNSPPGYIARAGFMQLGLVMPLVTPEHLERVGLPQDFASQLRYPIDDPDARMRHQWAPGGFVRALRDRGIPIEPIARPLARMALLDQPLGLVRLGVHTVGNYFREEGIAHALSNDLGRRVIPDDILWTLREIWHYDATGIWARTTPVSWYFEHGAWSLVLWLFVLGPAALVSMVVQWHTPRRAQALLIGLTAIALVLAHVLFVPVAFYRYLHPLPFFIFLTVLPMAQSGRLRP
jgi:hypothetical protein